MPGTSACSDEIQPFFEINSERGAAFSLQEENNKKYTVFYHLSRVVIYTVIK